MRNKAILLVHEGVHQPRELVSSVAAGLAPPKAECDLPPVRSHLPINREPRPDRTFNKFFEIGNEAILNSKVRPPIIVITFFIPVIPFFNSVIPAKAGIHRSKFMTYNLAFIDSRLRGNDNITCQKIFENRKRSHFNPLKPLDKSWRSVKLPVMSKINLMGSTLADLESLMADLGEKKYKGRQLFKWIYGSLQYDFNQMTDLTKELREKLDAKYIFTGLQPEGIAKSQDGTEKILFRLNDNKFIETVLISDGDKRTICVSTQVGCPIKCSFCATGLMGFKRNLTLGEIIGQLLYVRERYGENAYRNIVFMGMGEPLLNYENLVQAIKIISSSIGLSLTARKVTISTVGIVPKIYTLADSGLKVNLAISLHAATDKKRRRILSIPFKYDLKALMEAAACFARKRKKRVTFEYILFKGLNDSREDALALAELIKGIPCKINILAYNPVENVPYKRPSDEEINDFSKLLYPRAPAVTVRKSRGLDIDAACGQLAGKMQKIRRRR